MNEEVGVLSGEHVSNESEATPIRRRRMFIGAVIVIVLFALIIAAVRSYRGAQDAQAGASGKGKGAAVPVASATAQRRDVPVYFNGLGNATAFFTVTIKSRVDGQLERVDVQEGQRVRKGEQLALIDPRPYQAALSQAEAKRSQDAAQVQNARHDVERYADLYKQGVIPQQQYNTQQATVGVDEGAVRADDAAIENAKLNLAYCHIQSPIDGTVGLRNVDPGNMVHASDPNGLMVVTQLQPIAVLFTLPEDNLPIVAQRMRSGPLVLEAWSRDSTQKLATGSLQTVDNVIDPNTGTVRLKGIFENKDGALFPNQFVNARLRVEVRSNAIVIPAAAVQQGAKGTYVYVVKADKTAEERAVTAGLTQGTETIIEQGLSEGEEVVTDGQDKLQPGAKVEAAKTRGSGNGTSPAGSRRSGRLAAGGPAPAPEASPDAATDTAVKHHRQAGSGQ